MATTRTILPPGQLWARRRNWWREGLSIQRSQRVNPPGSSEGSAQCVGSSMQNAIGHMGWIGSVRQRVNYRGPVRRGKRGMRAPKNFTLT